MGEKPTDSSPNSRWPKSAADPSSHTLSLSSPSIDESPDFHDPYSELNLFLARKVKEELSLIGLKKWSVYLQEKLIEKISPEFRSRFPHYRLGVAALKKIWERVTYFSAAFKNHKEALTSEGKLNIRFLIRENLKQLIGKRSFSFHPYLLAQQLAQKISECLATYDGIRPVLRHITTLIWAAERHLIPLQLMAQQAHPYETFDAWDKLILKCMLERLGKNPQLSQEALQTEVREAIRILQQLPEDFGPIAAHVAATLESSSSSFSEPSAIRRLREEAACLLIDNPQQSAQEATDAATAFLAKARELSLSAHWVEVEHKITLWTIQGDLVYRHLRIEESPLLHLIQQYKNGTLRGVLHAYLRRYPTLSSLAPQIASRIRIFSRYVWYALQSSPEQPTIERFFEWHLKRLSSLHPIEDLEKICQQQLPLLPFDRKKAQFIHENHGKATNASCGHPSKTPSSGSLTRNIRNRKTINN